MQSRGGVGRSRPLIKRKRATPAGDDGGTLAAPAADISMRSEWMKSDVQDEIRSTFSGARPYPHAVIRPFLGEDGLKAVRDDLLKLGATEKETDLFRFFQTGDLAGALLGASKSASSSGPSLKKRKGVNSAKGVCAKAAKRAPSLTALAQIFASDDFRNMCSKITDCGELCDHVDLSAQIYSRRGHLLCHDDVIGTRKISFIYYLTDSGEDWEASEGGALELYPQEVGAPIGTPSTTPSKELLPLADSLALFVVEPGVSFHAVREVRGSRARVSIQGWLHAPSLEQTAAFDRRNVATLQQLLDRRGNNLDAERSDRDQKADAETDVAQGAMRPLEQSPTLSLSSEDIEHLGQFLAKEYIDPKCLEAIAERFAESSYAVLTGFLREDLAERIKQARAEVDSHDHLNVGAEESPVPKYEAGVEGGWRTVGPPHLRRFLRFSPSPENAPSAPRDDAAHAKLGDMMEQVARNLFSSPAFRKWLQLCTRLEPRSIGNTEVRRFRPGLDYTVAARAETAVVEAAELDATIAFVADGDTECTALWEGEDVGGFESYIAADEDDETVEAQETYRGADLEGPLVNLPAVSNALCLVMRDSQTFRFVKYLSRDAPSSRIDIAASYKVDIPADSSDEAQEPQEDQQA